MFGLVLWIGGIVIVAAGALLLYEHVLLTLAGAVR